jgi:FixJ family two-component response regulator
MLMTEPTVHVVDDDGPFLLAISRLLRASGFVVKTYVSANDFLAGRDDDAPGCVVCDLQMPEVDGLDLQAALARTADPLPILFLTGHADTVSTVRAMRNGAEDFLEKRAPKQQLLDAVQRALERNGRERTERARRDGLSQRFEAISPREREVLGLVAEGLTNQDIARRLVLSEHTVHRHMTNILRKLGLTSRAAAASLATRHDLP